MEANISPWGEETIRWCHALEINHLSINTNNKWNYDDDDDDDDDDNSLLLDLLNKLYSQSYLIKPPALTQANTLSSTLVRGGVGGGGLGRRPGEHKGDRTETYVPLPLCSQVGIFSFYSYKAGKLAFPYS